MQVYHSYHGEIKGKFAHRPWLLSESSPATVRLFSTAVMPAAVEFYGVNLLSAGGEEQ